MSIIISYPPHPLNYMWIISSIVYIHEFKVCFTINHFAAVVIPVTFGLIWLHSPGVVFLAGAAMALVSLMLARLVPADPGAGNEVVAGWAAAVRSRA